MPVKTAVRVRLAGGVRHVGCPQLEGKHDPVRQLGEVLQRLHVLEALEVQRQDSRQSLQSNLLLGLLLIFVVFPGGRMVFLLGHCSYVRARCSFGVFLDVCMYMRRFGLYWPTVFRCSWSPLGVRSHNNCCSLF